MVGDTGVLAVPLRALDETGDLIRVEGSVSKVCLCARMGEETDSRHAMRYESVEEQALITHPGTMISVISKTGIEVT